MNDMKLNRLLVLLIQNYVTEIAGSTIKYWAQVL